MVFLPMCLIAIPGSPCPTAHCTQVDATLFRVSQRQAFIVEVGLSGNGDLCTESQRSHQLRNCRKSTHCARAGHLSLVNTILNCRLFYKQKIGSLAVFLYALWIPEEFSVR